jgi:hypothetical protein
VYLDTTKSSIQVINWNDYKLTAFKWIPFKIGFLSHFFLDIHAK